jgi:hypothetical protein
VGVCLYRPIVTKQGLLDVQVGGADVDVPEKEAASYRARDMHPLALDTHDASKP